MTNETRRKLSDREIQQLEFREQVRGYGVDFWSDRNGWPINAPGKIYLLEAIEVEGKRLFGVHWTGREQAEQFVPVLLDGANVAAGGLEELYAIELLGTYRPDLGRSPVVETSDEIYRKPLSDEEWRVAFSIFNDVVSPERAVSRRRLRAAVNSIHARLVQGDMQAWSRSLRGVGDFRLIDQESWTIDVVMARFLFGLFDPHEPLDESMLMIGPHQIKASPLAEELWPEFIFLDADHFSQTSTPEVMPADRAVAKPKTRQEVENVEAAAEGIYHAMLKEEGRVTRRDHEARCGLDGIKSTISRRVFSRLNNARPGQRH